MTMDYSSRQKGLILNLNSRWYVIFVFIMMFPLGNTGHEPLCKKSFFRFLTAEEVLAQIEEDEAVTSAMVFIQPPSDGFDSEGDSGDEDTGGSVNNLSGKQLQANAEAIVVSISWSPEGNEGDNQIGCLFDSSADNPQLPLVTESSSTSGNGLRPKRKRRWVRTEIYSQALHLQEKHTKRACSMKDILSSSMMKKR